MIASNKKDVVLAACCSWPNGKHPKEKEKSQENPALCRHLLSNSSRCKGLSGQLFIGLLKR